MDTHREWWRWEIRESVDPDFSDTLWTICFYDTLRYPALHCHSPYMLFISGPGGLRIELVWLPPANTQIEYAYVPASGGHQAIHHWTIPVSYGIWKAMYSEGQATGCLLLEVPPHPNSAMTPPVTIDEIPAALVAELGACLTLPPSEWYLRPGWVDEINSPAQAGPARPGA